jgi:preprotein translocase subunit SecD
MWKKRLIALGVIILSLALGVLVARSTTPGKPFRLGLDLSGGAYLVYRADVSNVPAGEVSDSMSSLRDVIERRVNLFGATEPQVSTESVVVDGVREQRLVVELPGVTDVKKAITMIGQTPLLEFRIENPNFNQDGKTSVAIKPSDIKDGKINIGSISLPDRYIATPLTGRYLERATLQFDQQTNRPSVGLQFNSEGAKLFEEITRANIGKVVAIYLDGSPISEPNVNEAISGGQAVITGAFTPAEAKELVGRFNAGALPVPIELIGSETVGPTLGDQAIQAGVFAGIISLALIAIFLVVWYRVPGIIAALALLIYGIVSLALFKYIPITLTSAGIAGFIISLGMAVDANILIFERMKEELGDGKTLSEAIRIGFDRAWSSIRDGNISSLISAVILYWFGTPLIKGFALTFGIGVFVSMLSALTVTRIFLRAIVSDTVSSRTRFFFGSGFSRTK